MAYTPINWKDEPSHDTALEAANLNKMDSGIAANDTAIAGFQGAITAIQTANENITRDVTALQQQLNGVSIRIITRAAWNALEVKPATTLYIFNG